MYMNAYALMWVCITISHHIKYCFVQDQYQVNITFSVKMNNSEEDVAALPFCAHHEGCGCTAGESESCGVSLTTFCFTLPASCSGKT